MQVWTLRVPQGRSGRCSPGGRPFLRGGLRGLGAGLGMVTFYDFPKENLRTTNPVESPFAALRLRTDAAKRYEGRSGDSGDLENVDGRRTALQAQRYGAVWRKANQVKSKSARPSRDRRLCGKTVVSDKQNVGLYLDGIAVIPVEQIYGRTGIPVDTAIIADIDRSTLTSLDHSQVPGPRGHQVGIAMSAERGITRWRP